MTVGGELKMSRVTDAGERARLSTFGYPGEANSDHGVACVHADGAWQELLSAGDHPIECIQACEKKVVSVDWQVGT